MSIMNLLSPRGMMLWVIMLSLSNFSTAQSCAIMPNPEIQSVACFGGDDGRISVAPTGGTSPYSIEWSNGATGTIISQLTSGNYAFTITDADGCSTSGNYFVSQSTKILGNLTKADVDCHGDATGFASVNPTGGVAPYTYQWSNGATTQTATNLSAGAVSYTITDANGCIGTGSVSIFQPAPVWTTFTQKYACNGEANGTAEIFANGGTPPYTYLWSTGETTSRITGLAPGMYGYVVTDSRGCESLPGLVCIFFSPEPDDIRITTTPSNCDAPGSASVEVIGGFGPFTYSWSNGATAASLTGLAAGTYSVIVTDAGGCTYEASASVADIGSTVVVNVTPQPNGNLAASATGGIAPYTYRWSNGETVATANNFEAGDAYSVTATDANGCTASLNGLTPGNPESCPGNITFAGSIGSDQTLCAPGNVPERIVEITPATGGNGPIEYLWMSSSTSSTWDPGFYQPIMGANGPTYQPGPLDVTTYFVRCVRVEGCVYLETNPVTITVDNEIDPTINRPDLGCFGETTVFSVENTNGGDVTWSFSGPVTTNTLEGASIEVTFVGAGPLSFTVTIATDDCTGRFSERMLIASCGLGGEGGNQPAAYRAVSVDSDVASSFARPELGEGLDTPTNMNLSGNQRQVGQQTVSEISVSPNPVQNLTMLEFGEELSTSAIINVYTLNQNQIASYPVAPYTRRMELSLAGQPAGLYLVQIIQDGQPLRTLRLVKQ